MRLWDSHSTSLDAAVLSFTVGSDPILDAELLPFDCLGSAAHALMLERIGVLSADESAELQKALKHAFGLAEGRSLPIRIEHEDGHTALEAFLTDKLGDTGKKIHTGRSRNDQVIMAVRLWGRAVLLDIFEGGKALVDALLQRAAEHNDVLMPGYTHTRQAMPSTVGQLLTSVAEGLMHDLQALRPALDIANRSALGSASGYGVPVPLDREYVADMLGLDGCEINTITVQNSRGRFEAAALFALHQISLTLSRAAADFIWFSSEAFGFFGLPDELTTGSSIMPQKRNPDVLELVRAVPSTMMARYCEVTGLLHGLPAGYHRDLQRTKSPILSSVHEIRDVLTIMKHAVEKLIVYPEACAKALRKEIYATDNAYEKVKGGMSFREAYRDIKDSGATELSADDVLAARTHLGAPGTEQATVLREEMARLAENFKPYVEGVAKARALLG